MAQVFISYSSKDTAKTNEIVAALEAQGIACWIAPRDIGIGSSYMKAIPVGLRECSHFLLVLSRNSQNSVWVEKELGQAIKLRREVFPLLIEDCPISDTFDFLLENIQFRPYYNDKPGVLRELVSHIPVRQLPSKPVRSPAAASPAPKIPELSPEEYYQRGKNSFLSENYSEAVNCYRKAAERNHVKAQYSLGLCYSLGKGIARSYHSAIHWWQKAAGSGNCSAQYHLGDLYYFGPEGIRNDTLAFKWFSAAAEQGESIAQYYLAQCYENGRGVSRDLNAARKWYQAASGYVPQAKQALERLQ